MYSMAGTRHALTLRSKGQSQGHAVFNRAAGVGMQVDMTAYRFRVNSLFTTMIET